MAGKPSAGYGVFTPFRAEHFSLEIIPDGVFRK
jgi:hypothetical protein